MTSQNFTIKLVMAFLSIALAVALTVANIWLFLTTDHDHNYDGVEPFNVTSINRAELVDGVFYLDATFDKLNVLDVEGYDPATQEPVECILRSFEARTFIGDQWVTAPFAGFEGDVSSRNRQPGEQTTRTAADLRVIGVLLPEVLRFESRHMCPLVEQTDEGPMLVTDNLGVVYVTVSRVFAEFELARDGGYRRIR